MAGALLYLWLCQTRNRVRVRLGRLREPRYLLGSIFGIAYFGYFIVIRNPAFAGRQGQGGWTAVARGAETLELIAAAVMLLLAAFVWLVPAARHPIRFSPSEVQFLFPAPLTRRQLLSYRLLRAQLGILFGSAIATLFMRPASLASGWKFLIGLWLILLTSRVYFVAVSLYREGLRQRGTGGLRRWGPAAAAVGAVALVAMTVSRAWPALTAMSTRAEVVGALGQLASSGAVGWVLWPFRALSSVPLAGTTVAFWWALPGAFAVLAINYVWVLRADTAFEESAALLADAGATTTSSESHARRTSGAMSTPFVLAPTGRPEAAIVWKNLIMVGRYASITTLLRLVPAVIAVGILVTVATRRGEFASAAPVLCLVLLALTILFGPMMSRNDLRRDLGHLAMLKAWPLSGATLLRGEILAPTVLLTAVAWLLILGAAALIGGMPMRDVPLAVFNRISYATAALVVAPALILTQVTVLNGLAVLFPAWIATGAARARGVDAMGQRLLTTTGLLIALVGALIPAALVAGVVAGAVYAATGVVLVILPAMIVATVLVVECVAAVEALGRVLDRTDVSAVSPVE